MNFEVYRAYKKFKKENNAPLSKRLKWAIGLSIVFIVATIVYFIFYFNWIGIIALDLLITVLVILILENGQADSTPETNFINQKSKRQSLCELLNQYEISDKENYTTLLEWVKTSILDYENRVKKTFSILGTITLSGVLTLACSVLPAVFDAEAMVPESLLNTLGFAASLLFSLFLLFVGVYSAEYFDYVYKKAFAKDIQDILDYKLYEKSSSESLQDEKVTEYAACNCKK